jgi:polyribonucleotide nucleotidyltransferase
MVSAVSATRIKEGQDFFPLTVDYREKAAAVGKFPGGYFRREGRPSEKEILTARMTDRPLRPLFPKGYLYDTQIISILLSADGENDPDMLSINGASAALMVSDIPFAGPVGAVRVGRVRGEFIANPTHSQRAESDLDLVYVGTRDEVIMIEGEANEIPEADFIKAMEFGHAEAKKIIAAQKELAAADPANAKAHKTRLDADATKAKEVAKTEKAQEEVVQLLQSISRKLAMQETSDDALLESLAALAVPSDEGSIPACAMREGDVDLDGDIDADDLASFLEAWSSGDLVRGDLNRDGVVDGEDFLWAALAIGSAQEP